MKHKIPFLCLMLLLITITIQAAARIEKVEPLTPVPVLVAPSPVVVAPIQYEQTASPTTLNQNYAQLSSMLNRIKLKDLEFQQFMLIQYSSSLSFYEKSSLFEQHKKNGLGTSALNFLLGLGIGSFIQGDTTTGMISMIAEVVGLSMLLTATTYETVQLGTIIIGAARLYEVIAPYGYANRYNQTLRSTLQF